MSLTIDMPNRVIEHTESGVRLLFERDGGLFYLRVIALIAEKMKERNDWDADSGYIPVSEFQDRAWAFNGEKTRKFKSKQSMRLNIYQTFRTRFEGDEDCKRTYRIIWPDDESKAKRILPNPAKLFAVAAGVGPEMAAYRINEDPSRIEIVTTVGQHDAMGNELFSSSALEGASNDQKVNLLIEMLRDATTPGTYRDIISSSCDAVRAFLCNEEVSTVGKEGNLPFSIDHYADKFVKYLGVQGVSGDILMWSWIDELAQDSRWEQLMTVTAEFSPSSNEIPIPRRVATLCAEEGDVVSLLWLFHTAYVSSASKVKRKRFFSLLDKQPISVQNRIYEEMGKQIAGGEASTTKIAASRDEALKVLYLKTKFSLQWRPSQ